MFKIVQELEFTRYITNTINISDETCDRWTRFSEDWGFTYEDGSKIVFDPELVESNWGLVESPAVKTRNPDIKTLYDLMHMLAEDDFAEARFDYQDDYDDDVGEKWHTEKE